MDKYPHPHAHSHPSVGQSKIPYRLARLEQTACTVKNSSSPTHHQRQHKTHLRVVGGAVGATPVTVGLGAGGSVVHAGGRVVAPVAPAAAALLHLAAPVSKVDRLNKFNHRNQRVEALIYILIDGVQVVSAHVKSKKS